MGTHDAFTFPKPENGLNRSDSSSPFARFFWKWGLKIGLAPLITSLAPSAALAAKGWAELGYGTGSLLDASAVTQTTDSLGLARVPQASLGVQFSNEKQSVRPILSVQYRVFSPENAAKTNFPIQTITPMFGISIRRIWIQIGLTPLLWTQSTSQHLSFFSGYAQRSDYLSGRVEFGYHYPITPEISITGTLGSQLFISSADQTLNGQAIDGTVGFRFWIGGVKDLSAKNRGYYGEEDDNYKGWRYPFGQGF